MMIWVNNTANAEEAKQIVPDQIVPIELLLFSADKLGKEFGL